MQKPLAIILIILIASGVSTQSVAAAIGKNEGMKILGLQTAKLRNDSTTAMKLETTECRSVIQLEPVSMLTFPKLLEGKDAAGEPDGQASPTTQQNPPVHHSHHLRNFIIIFAIGAGLLIGLAAAAK